MTKTSSIGKFEKFPRIFEKQSKSGPKSGMSCAKSNFNFFGCWQINIFQRPEVAQKYFSVT